MANVIHRTTLQFIASANTPDYPEPTWKHNPDMTAVAGVAARYWKSPADWDAANAGPVEMAQGEKDAVDAAIVEAARDAVAERFDDAEEAMRAFMLVCLDEFNAHALKLNAILDAVDAATSLANLKTLVGQITDYPQRTGQQLRTAVRGKLGS